LVSPTPEDDPTGRWSELRRSAMRLDAEPRLLAMLRRLRGRLPGDENFGDPLSTGGETTVAYVARGISALQPAERESVLGEISLAGLQLWQSLSEAAGRGRGDQPLALLFTDLVGFSSFALAAGDSAALELLTEAGHAVETAVTDHGGRVAKRLGDGLFATFLDAGGAVEAALEAHAAMDTVTVRGYHPRMRAGVHWGRPRKLGGDFLGVDVSIAAHVGESARSGQVLVSEAVLEQIDSEQLALRVGRRKRLRLRGAAEDLRVATIRRRV
jgi:adenylate cyclase